MFAIEGRTTTFVKDQGARGGAIIGADVFPSRSIKEKHAVLSSMKTSNHHWLHQARQLDPVFLNNPKYTFVNCSEEQNKPLPSNSNAHMAASPGTIGKERCLSELRFLPPSV